MIQVSWTALKQLIIQKQVYPQFIEDDATLHVILVEGPLAIYCLINKTLQQEDLGDFNLNYRDLSNKSLDISKDSENAPIHRMKTAPAGWTYHAHSFEFKTSTPNSIFNKNWNNEDYGFCTLKFFDINNVELTEAIDMVNCVKTEIDWEPTHDYEIISGRVYFKDTIEDEEVRLWVVGVPDHSHENGGSKEMASGINLDFLDYYQPITTDGRVSKRMNYSSTLHTNKLRFILRHPAGKIIPIMSLLEMYKA